MLQRSDSTNVPSRSNGNGGRGAMRLAKPHPPVSSTAAIISTQRMTTSAKRVLLPQPTGTTVKETEPSVLSRPMVSAQRVISVPHLKKSTPTQLPSSVTAIRHNMMKAQRVIRHEPLPEFNPSLDDSKPPEEKPHVLFQSKSKISSDDLTIVEYIPSPNVSLMPLSSSLMHPETLSNAADVEMTEAPRRDSSIANVEETQFLFDAPRWVDFSTHEHQIKRERIESVLLAEEDASQDGIIIEDVVMNRDTSIGMPSKVDDYHFSRGSEISGASWFSVHHPEHESTPTKSVNFSDHQRSSTGDPSPRSANSVLLSSSSPITTTAKQNRASSTASRQTSMPSSASSVTLSPPNSRALLMQLEEDSVPVQRPFGTRIGTGTKAMRIPSATVASNIRPSVGVASSTKPPPLPQPAYPKNTPLTESQLKELLKQHNSSLPRTKALFRPH